MQSPSPQRWWQREDEPFNVQRQHCWALLKGSSPSTAAGGCLLRTGSPPAQDIAAVGAQLHTAANPLWTRPLVPPCWATRSVLLSRQPGKAGPQVPFASWAVLPSRVSSFNGSSGKESCYGDWAAEHRPTFSHGAKQSKAPELNGIFWPPLLTHLRNKGATSLLRTCCNALSCLLSFVSVLEQQLAPGSKEAATCNYRGKVLKDTGLKQGDIWNKLKGNSFV